MHIPASQWNSGLAPGVTALKEGIAAGLRPYVDSSRPYALLDFPNHPNVGDSAIWLGELAYFQAVVGSRPSFVCHKLNFDADALRRAVPEGTVFLHGGGNFGDIWPEFQTFRENVLALFPGRRIVQLPQTVHFEDPRALAMAAAAIEAHGNFVLFVRDCRSYEIAASSFNCPVHLIPDMALWLGAMPRPKAATRSLLLLLREDKESARHGMQLPCALPPNAAVADWLEEVPALYRSQKRRTLATGFRDLGVAAFSRARQRDLLFQNLDAHRLDRGLKLLSSAAFVITDRLHCHILCVLLGIPHIALDNSYGKLSEFINAWTGDCGIVKLAASVEEAFGLWLRTQTCEGQKTA